MAQNRSPASCPVCDGAALRVILTAPAMATVLSEIRRAHGVNERAAHAPKTSGKLREAFAEMKSHGAGCARCGGAGKKSTAVKAADGSVTLPTKRPWMISH